MAIGWLVVEHELGTAGLRVFEHGRWFERCAERKWYWGGSAGKPLNLDPLVLVSCDLRLVSPLNSTPEPLGCATTSGTGIPLVAERSGHVVFRWCGLGNEDRLTHHHAYNTALYGQPHHLEQGVKKDP